MKYLIFILIFVSVLTSCEKEIEIDIEKKKEKLVVNSLFNTEELWELELSKSKFVFDTGRLEMINDAQVSIEDSKGNIVLLTNNRNGIYKSVTEKPEIGETYKLEVSHSFLDDISATSTLPGKVLINELTKGGTFIVNGTTYKELLISFMDSPEDDNYLIEVQTGYWEQVYDTITWLPIDSVYVIYPAYFFTNSYLVENSGEKGTSESISFTDEFINGKEITIDLKLGDYYFDPYWGASWIYVSVSKISKDYYLYQLSYQKYLMTNGDPFAQPVQVYSNVENGLGVFAGYSTSLDSLKVR